jgi:pre-mRNA-processing factor 19
LCDLESSTVLDTVSSSSPFTCTSFHPDGHILATGQQDSQVRLWDVKARTVATTFNGHESPIASLCFSENGYYFATTSLDSDVVKFWDLRKLVEFHSLKAPYPVSRVRFDQSGKYVGMCGDDGLA